MAFDHMPNGRVLYWPLVHVHDVPMTPREAWRARLARDITPAEFARVLKAFT